MHRSLVRAVTACGAATALVSTAMAQAPTTPGQYQYGPHMGWWGGGWDGMFFGPLFMLLIVVAVVAAIAHLVRRPVGSWQGTPQAPGRTALDILKERFARGEIDKADYEERRRVLGE
ncbi:SHOCT domain-containing protein [Devosia sp. XJ19-1]|uniref:SHOCT domain-containing protein n=1 Tax=Devosia ureilytica TaxID=2952754 RepID=A0A9Q4FRC9_9HYPH|nr:SHOCT domain-containing protein [Devosia ureilytica]MCP8882413.1 SHOCT domain-containing protein [Devosia ureilytica]MCP8885700.1 SHOCT domain-containing protein [Devosia ureilytica]